MRNEPVPPFCPPVMSLVDIERDSRRLRAEGFMQAQTPAAAAIACIEEASFEMDTAHAYLVEQVRYWKEQEEKQRLENVELRRWLRIGVFVACGVWCLSFWGVVIFFGARLWR